MGEPDRVMIPYGDIEKLAGIHRQQMSRWDKAGLTSEKVKGRKCYDAYELIEFLSKRRTKGEDTEQYAVEVDDSEPVDTFDKTIERVRREEKAAALHVRKLRKANKPSMAATTHWEKMVDMRLKLEKQLPRIMHDAGKYVDADEVALIVSRACTEMVMVLDQVGITCGEEIVNKAEHIGRPMTASDYRNEIDKAVQKAKGRIQAKLESVVSEQ